MIIFLPYKKGISQIDFVYYLFYIIIIKPGNTMTKGEINGKTDELF